MLCKLATEEQHARVRRVSWHPLEEEAAPPPPPQPEELQEVRDALASALQDAHHWRERALKVDKERESESRAAYEKGLAEGLLQGRKEADVQLQPVLERSAEAIAATAMFRERLRRETESDLVRLCLQVAQRVLHREVNTDPDALAGVLRSALDKMHAGELLRVQAHPLHAAGIRGELESLGVRNVEVMEDNVLRPGELRLETTRGMIDASVQTQLLEIERGFTQRLRA